MIETFNFDFIFIKRFSKLIIQISNNESVRVLIVFLLLVTVLNEAAIYNVGMITGAYYKILGDKDWQQFWVQTIKALVLIIALALIKSCKAYVSSTVFIEWRKSLTKKIHFLYFSDLNYYELNVIEREKDNLDQRITQDVETFCRHLSTILPELIVSPFIIGFYTYHSFLTIGYIGPLGCVLFFAMSTFINRSLISSVLNCVYMQQKAEGNFRFQHLHVRNNAESIALQSGNSFEFNKSEKLFDRLVSVQENLILREFGLKSSVYLFDYLGSIVSFVVLSFPLFAGKYDMFSATDLSQLISQNTFVSMYLINCFTRLIDTSTEFTTIGGTTHRIAEVLELLERKQTIHKRNDSNSSLNNLSIDYSRRLSEAKVYFRLTNVSINVPKSERILIKGINLEMNSESNLLISGASGTAKTSILRVLKGVWKEKSGSVERYLPTDDPKMVLFLPQKPVMTSGSLLEQISYPLIPENSRQESDALTREQISHYMNFLDLNQIMDRIDNDMEREVDWNWNDCLSPGEQQRISFVRLFQHKPVVAVLDESTSAVSVDMERKIYEECNRLGIGLISCGHRKSLEEYHSQVLRIVKSENPIDCDSNDWVYEKL